APDTEVKVVVERRPPGKKGDLEVRTVKLARLEESRATFETQLTQTPEGDYAFWLSQPAVPEPKPRAECKVLAPPHEMYGPRMNQRDLEAGALESRGAFKTLATADTILDELPTGARVTLNSSGPPWQLWNNPLLYLLALLLLTTEWLLRK